MFHLHFSLMNADSRCINTFLTSQKFFRRGLKENGSYVCKGSQGCSINPRMRNNCRFCRYQKCLVEGMSREGKLNCEIIIYCSYSIVSKEILKCQFLNLTL